MLKPGDSVQDFTLADGEGNSISLSDFKGKRVIVYFYPRDNTPGCTTEACSFRDEYERFTDRDTVVLGISGDSQKSHQNFKTKYGLPFHLLSDTEKEVIKAFGAWGEKKNYGKVYEGLLRSTFILNRDHVVEHVFEKVKTKDHALAVLSELDRLDTDSL